jgi:hypothetical protein
MSRSIETFVKSITNKTVIKVILSDNASTYNNEPLISFFSMSHPTKFPSGQKIADYWLATFKASDPKFGLSLMGGVDEWSISSETKRYLQKWIDENWSSIIPESFYEVFEGILKFDMGLWLKVHTKVVYNTTLKQWNILPVAFENLDANEVWFEFREFHSYFEDLTSNSPNPDNLENRYNAFIQNAIQKKESLELKIGV